MTFLILHCFCIGHPKILLQLKVKTEEGVGESHKVRSSGQNLWLKDFKKTCFR